MIENDMNDILDKRNAERRFLQRLRSHEEELAIDGPVFNEIMHATELAKLESRMQTADGRSLIVRPVRHTDEAIYARRFRVCRLEA